MSFRLWGPNFYHDFCFESAQGIFLFIEAIPNFSNSISSHRFPWKSFSMDAPFLEVLNGPSDHELGGGAKQCEDTARRYVRLKNWPRSVLRS